MKEWSIDMSCEHQEELFCCAHCCLWFPMDTKLAYKRCLFCSPECAGKADTYISKDPVVAAIHELAGILYYGRKERHYLDFATILGHYVRKINRLAQERDT